MPPKKSGGGGGLSAKALAALNAPPSTAPPVDLSLQWFSASSSSSPLMQDPTPPIPLTPYIDDVAQLRALRGKELHALLEEDERLSAAHTGELSRLQGELKSRMRDTTDMVKYLEAEVRRKDLMAKRLNKQLADLKTSHTQDVAMMSKQFEHTGRYMEKIFMEKEKQLMEKNQQLESQIKDLSEFQSMRTALSSELESTKALIFTNERLHKLQLDELEKKFLSARDGLQREATQRILNSRATYKTEIGIELENESKNVRIENESLRNHLSIHEKTSDRLQKEHVALTKRICELKISYEINGEKKDEYMKKNLRQTERIDEFTQHISALEKKLYEALAERENIKRNQLDLIGNKIQPLEQSLAALKIKAAQVDSTNKSLRKQAKRLLTEKRETERFFLSAIEDTKNNMKKKQEIQRKENLLLQQAQLRELTLPVALRTKLPSIPGSTSDIYSPSPSSSASLSLGDLPLEDRSRVLRLLYAKLSHTPSGLSLRLPKHSFEISVAEEVQQAQWAQQQQLQQTEGGERAQSAGEQRNSHPSSSPFIPPLSLPVGGSPRPSSAQLPQLLPSEPQSQQSSSRPPQQPQDKKAYDMTFLTNMKAEEEEAMEDETELAEEDDDDDGNQSYDSRDDDQY